MDLKSSSWHLEHLLDALETDFVEATSSTAAEQEPHNARGPAIRRTSKSEELDYVKARLQAIGLSVGQG